MEVLLTDTALNQIYKLKSDKGLTKRLVAVKKALRFLSQNPKHPSLNTHEFTTLKGSKGERVFVAYAETKVDPFVKTTF